MCILLLFIYIHVGIRTRPALNDLSAEVKEVSDWHQLGLYLGIDSTSLDTIQTKYPNVGNTRWRNEVLSEWLRKEENASWEDVINALNQMGEKRIALRIRKKYGVHSQQSAGEARQALLLHCHSSY